MTKLPFKFSGIDGKLGNTLSEESLKAVMEGPFPTFFAVEDPIIVQDSIPRDLIAVKDVMKTVPSKIALPMFESFEQATAYAQRQNRNLLILEVTVKAKVIPQLPMVERITQNKAA